MTLSIRKSCIFFSILIMTLSSHSLDATEEQSFEKLGAKEASMREAYRKNSESLQTAVSDTKRVTLHRAMKVMESAGESIDPSSITPENIEALNTLLKNEKMHLYAKSKGYTPVLYTGEFSSVFGGNSGGLLLDDYLQIDPLEFVAFPDTVFRVKGVSFDKGNLILTVIADEYSYIPDTGHYIDARFVDMSWKPISSPKNRTILSPDMMKTIEKLRSQVGKIYIWGGNTQTGISKLYQLYHPKKQIDAITKKKWRLDGFDCSGLLFWATNGWTPRNTSNLVSYGTGVEIAGKTKDEIINLLKPLDIIVWVGHNMIVLDNDEVIESRVDFGSGVDMPNGVRIRTIDDVLDEVLAKRIPVNSWKDTVPEGRKKFVIRRWIGE